LKLLETEMIVSGNTDIL